MKTLKQDTFIKFVGSLLTVLFLVMYSPITYAVIPTNGLVGYWKFDEASGTTAVDSSGLNNTGTLTNGPIRVAGKIGSALNLDGINDYVRINDLDASSVTVSMWIKQSQAAGNWKTLVMKRSTYGFEENGTTMYFKVGNGSTWSQTVSAPITLNQWEHFVGVYNGSMVTLYKNGVQVGGPVSGTLTNSDQLLLIGSWNASSEFFAGQIDEVAIYNRALSTSEIQAIFNAASGSPDTTAPVISNVISTSTTQNSTTITWTTNEQSDTQVEYGTTTSYGLSTILNPNMVTSHSQTVLGLNASTTYQYRVSSRDAALNPATSTNLSFTTQAIAVDTTPPTVSVMAPINGAIVSTMTTVSANAADNIGVMGVQFKLDGTALNAEDTVPPYSINWSTTQTTNGSHVLSSVARDVAGNSATSAAVNVTVSNTVLDTTPPSVPTNLTATALSSSQINLSWTASTDNVGVTGYQINQIASTSQTSYVVSGLLANTTYSYSVSAFDSAGNTSALSQAVAATTLDNSTGPFNGTLRVSTINPRYFTDNSGKAIYLAGGHTWENFTDNGYLDPPTPFDYADYLNMMQSRGDNLIRLWTWEQSKWMTFTTAPYYFGQSPFQRTGPGLASDGKPKFDLTKFDQSYFDRLRQHVIDAGNKGIYAAIMLFNGWSLEKKGQVQNPWPGHVMNAANNINGINGDLDGDGTGNDSHTLGSSAITAIQDAYLRKLIDSVNDLDNVLYEVTNEDQGSSQNITWQYHVINYVKNYEATKAKQHPAGMTGYCGGCDDAALYASPADWIAPSNLSYKDNPPAADGRKVIISDTDHLWGANGGDRVWVWKSFTRGVNTLFMDTYGSTDYADAAHPGSNPNSPVWISLRQNMGYAINYSRKMNLNLATPQSSLFSTGYGLANAAASNAEYLGYLPSGGSITINLSATPGNLTVEWFNTQTGVAIGGAAVAGGASRTLTAPFSGDAVVYLTNTSPDSVPPTAPGNLSATGSLGSVALSWNAASDNIGVAAYNVHRSNVSGFTPSTANRIAQTSNTSLVDQVASGTYYYRVTAQDAAQNVSSPSNEASATITADTDAPTAPTNLQASNVTDRTLTISWSGATDNVVVAGYKVYRDSLQIATTTQNNFNDSSLTASTTYNYSVVAFDGAQNVSPFSPVLTITTQSVSALSAGLIAYWRFDETSGTTASDSSGNGKIATLVNGPTFAAGKIGNALTLDGTNDYASIGEVASNIFSVSIWLKQPQALSNWGSLVMKRHVYGFESNGQTINFSIGNGSGWTGNIPTAITLNQWEHLVGVYDGSTMRLYRNGILVGGPLSAAMTNSSVPLLIGSWNTTAEFFKGQIDEIRIYNRALSASEVTQLFNQ